MEENKGFKIFGDEEPIEDETDVSLEEKVEPVEESSSSAKPVFIALIAFCILGALLFLGYYQLTSRINRIESAGTHEIKGLNKEVNERLTSLSETLAEQNTKLTEQVESLTKQLADLNSQAKKNASAIASAEKVLNSTKQSTGNTMRDLETRLSALVGRMDKTESTNRQSISGINERVASLGNALEETRQAAGRVAGIRQDLDNMKARLSAMAAGVEKLQADQVAANNSAERMTRLEQELNRQLKATEGKLQQNISALGEQIVALEAMMKSFKSMAVQSPSTGKNASGSPNIIEQEIQ